MACKSKKKESKKILTPGPRFSFFKAKAVFT